MTAKRMTLGERIELLISLGAELQKGSYIFSSGYGISYLGVMELTHKRFAEKIEEIKKSLSKIS